MFSRQANRDRSAYHAVYEAHLGSDTAAEAGRRVNALSSRFTPAELRGAIEELTAGGVEAGYLQSWVVPQLTQVTNAVLWDGLDSVDARHAAACQSEWERRQALLTDD